MDFNIGVYPYVEIQIAVYDPKLVQNRIVINARNYDECYGVDPSGSRCAQLKFPSRPPYTNYGISLRKSFYL